MFFQREAVASFEIVPHSSLPKDPLFCKLRPTRITVPDPSLLRNNIRTSLMYLTVWASTRNHAFPAPVIDEHIVLLDDVFPSIANSGSRQESDPLDTTVAVSLDQSRA